jgi:regulator of microtubule dynamics protein 3
MISKMRLFIAISVLFATIASAQNQDELFSKGLLFKKEMNYKEGFAVFQQLLKSDSSKADYLQNASFFYSRYGRTLPESVQMNYYKTAEYLARKAIKANTSDPECHYVYALALGRINENASTKQKIANAKLIKSELDIALKMNPRHAGAWHILGRWHRTIAGFSTIEKLAINTLFGGVPPGGSYEDAVKCFTQAIIIEPKYKMHQYELANTYYEMGKNADAKVWLQKAKALARNSVDDDTAEEKCKELEKKMQ